MTYKAAQQSINDNWDIISPRLVGSTPPHMVLNCIIAPEGSRIERLAAIFDKIQDEHISNEEILLDMGLSGNNLIVYVALKMKGYIYFLAFDSYSKVPWALEETEEGNAS